MDDPAPLASLSLTHVRYNPADDLSYVSAWLALVPQALCVIYVTLIWSTREIEVLLMFGGQMACELLNFGLKRWIKEERPQPECLVTPAKSPFKTMLKVPEMHGKGYGMPSSHAQFVSFFSLSLTLFLLFRHQPSSTHRTSANPSSISSTNDKSVSYQTPAMIYPTYKQSTLTERAILSILALIGAASVAASRIYLSYHTPRQVVVGVLAGAVFAVVWFAFTAALRRLGWIEWALETELARRVRMRDLIVTEDLQDAGWARWDERRRLMRLRKKD